MKTATLTVSEHGISPLETFTFVAGATDVDIPFHTTLLVLHVGIEITGGGAPGSMPPSPRNLASPGTCFSESCYENTSFY